MTAAELLNEAVALHQAGLLDDAEAVYRRILATQPDHFDGLHLLGVIFAQNGRYTEAVDQIDSALKIIPNHFVALNDRANALLALRRFDEALASWNDALAVRPDAIDIYANRGATLHSLKRFNEALASWDRALTLRPDYIEVLANRGVTLLALERFDEALVNCDRALTLRPDFPEALSNRSLVLHNLKRFEESLAGCDQALTLRPDYVEAHYNRANTLHALERYEEAVAAYDRVLALRPNYPEAWSNRGNTLKALERFADALASYDRALTLRPDYVEALSNRGLALQKLKRLDEALASYDRALTLRSTYAEAYSNRGLVLEELKRFEEALISYDHALTLRPDFAEALTNRGLALQKLKRFDEALASHDRALEVRPDHVEAYVNRGRVLEELKRFEEALACYGHATRLRPSFAQAHHNEALCRLLIGDLHRGWEKYEWRWETEQLKRAKRNFSQKLWLGSDEIAGKCILLHAEQGFGDTIQFCRYVPLVAKRASRVILEVPKPLHQLMSSLAGAAQIVARGDPLPAFDLHCPLLSLPLALKTQLETIPSKTPYLSAPESKISAWRNRLGNRERARIGIVWAGNPRKETLVEIQLVDRQRSIEFSRLKPLFREPYCDFYSLQKGDDAVRQLGDSSLCHSIIDLTDHLHDFSDTAALIENLDLVISVDTSVAHLAGALGKPFWLLNRYNTCWRWLLDREDTPWYPTGRLFRQDQTRDWDNVIARVHAALRHYALRLARPSPSGLPGGRATKIPSSA
jgi:tetratricopeptide (TPR) repeat protein